MKKRISGIIFALVMVLSLVPTMAFAKDHECVAAEGWSANDGKHCRYCAICGASVGEWEAHTYEDGYCTVCGITDPDNHTCVAEESEFGDIDWVRGEEGHYKYCAICGNRMGDAEEHVYGEGVRCTVCGWPNPTHECVVGSDWYWLDGEYHVKRCIYCGKDMDFETHSYENGCCTVCDAIDPNHECTPNDYWDWTDQYHYKTCSICGSTIGEMTEHYYENGRCTVCSLPDPDHECTPGNYWQMDDIYHYKTCSICGNIVGEMVEHSYENGYCTVCDMIDPFHTCVGGGWYDLSDGMHCQYCKICGTSMNVGEHNYENGRCTVCYQVDPNHDCVPGEYFVQDESGHCPFCSICGKEVGQWEPHTYAYGYCSVCGMENPKYNDCTHQWSLEKTVPATCNTEGENIYVCSECGDRYSESIPTTAHHYTGTVTKKPTCGASGWRTYKCSDCGAFGYTEEIEATENHHLKKIGVKPATCTANGRLQYYTCTVCGVNFKDSAGMRTVSKDALTLAKVKSVTLSATSYTYNGNVKTPTVTVKDSNGKVLKKGTDYKVTYASGRKAVGTYKVTVEGIGNYSFTKILTFKINPAATKIVSATNKATKSIVVKWNKVSGVTGYQVQYVVGNTTKTVKVAKASTVSKTISKLTRGKTYKVKVRSYKTVNGNTYYSAWSATRSVKVEK